MFIIVVANETQPVNPKENQSWIFIGRTDAQAETPILWPSDAKNWLIGKDPDNGKDWRQEQKGTTEDELVGWYYWRNGHEFEQAPGVGDEQRSLVCWSMGLQRVGHDQVAEQYWTGLSSISRRRRTPNCGFCYVSTSSLLGRPSILVTIWCFALLDSILCVYTFPSES